MKCLFVINLGLGLRAYSDQREPQGLVAYVNKVLNEVKPENHKEALADKHLHDDQYGKRSKENSEVPRNFR